MTNFEMTIWDVQEIPGKGIAAVGTNPVDPVEGSSALSCAEHGELAVWIGGDFFRVAEPIGETLPGV